jgi:hypothetical protein
MTACSLWVLERSGLRILGDPSQTIATAMLFRTITQPAWPYRPKIPHPGEISGLALGPSDRSPRVRRVTFALIPAASTSAASVQASGFEDIGLLTHCGRLVCDSCSSGQCFAFSFLRIPPRGAHPCRSANRPPCRVGRGLSPPSRPATTTVTKTAPVKALRAMPGAPKKTPGLTAGRSLARKWKCSRSVLLWRAGLYRHPTRLHLLLHLFHLGLQCGLTLREPGLHGRATLLGLGLDGRCLG